MEAGRIWATLEHPANDGTDAAELTESASPSAALQIAAAAHAFAK